MANMGWSWRNFNRPNAMPIDIRALLTALQSTCMPNLWDMNL